MREVELYTSVNEKNIWTWLRLVLIYGRKLEQFLIDLAWDVEDVGCILTVKITTRACSYAMLHSEFPIVCVLAESTSWMKLMYWVGFIWTLPTQKSFPINPYYQWQSEECWSKNLETSPSTSFFEEIGLLRIRSRE